MLSTWHQGHQERGLMKVIAPPPHPTLPHTIYIYIYVHNNYINTKHLQNPKKTHRPQDTVLAPTPVGVSEISGVHLDPPSRSPDCTGVSEGVDGTSQVVPCLALLGKKWVWINTYINTIFSGMNIHLPAILMFTRATWF